MAVFRLQELLQLVSTALNAVAWRPCCVLLVYVRTVQRLNASIVGGVSGACPPKVPLSSWGIRVPLTHASLPAPNGISVGSAVFAYIRHLQTGNVTQLIGTSHAGYRWILSYLSPVDKRALNTHSVKSDHTTPSVTIHRLTVTYFVPHLCELIFAAIL